MQAGDKQQWQESYPSRDTQFFPKIPVISKLWVPEE
jgi:hypothetical protein